jgi:hypothetical protein
VTTASFQGYGVAQGRQFAEQCDVLLQQSGFTLRRCAFVVESLGVEIDREAVAPSGATVWFEYKGSVQGTRPGLMRTDTLKKAIANGALIATEADVPPYVVLTSHLPERGCGLAMLNAAKQARYLADVICIYQPADAARLRHL